MVVQAVAVCTAAGAWAVTAAAGGGWVYRQMALQLEAFGCCHAALCSLCLAASQAGVISRHAMASLTIETQGYAC